MAIFGERKFNFRKAFYVIPLMILLSACGRSTPKATVTPTQSSTPIPSATPTLTPIPTNTPTPTITPTPGIGSTRISPVDDMVQVYIPAGEFIMGSDFDIHALASPPHTVYLGDYWIDQTEVTVSMYMDFLAARLKPALLTDEIFRSSDWINESELVRKNLEKDEWQAVTGKEDHPIVDIPWEGAHAYCQWAGRRLPTEAEWEKAGRGPEGYLFPWGNEFDCSKGNFLDRDLSGKVILGGPDCDGYHDTAPVGSFPDDASPYGVMDMAGNVQEYVFDWFDSDYYWNSPYKNPLKENPPQNIYLTFYGGERVIRGGDHFEYDWVDASVVSRSFGRLYYSNSWTGFRCAQSLPLSELTLSREDILEVLTGNSKDRIFVDGLINIDSFSVLDRSEETINNCQVECAKQEINSDENSIIITMVRAENKISAHEAADQLYKQFTPYQEEWDAEAHCHGFVPQDQTRIGFSEVNDSFVVVSQISTLAIRVEKKGLSTDKTNWEIATTIAFANLQIEKLKHANVIMP